MFCAYCGRQIDDKSKYCPYCGVKVINPGVFKKPSAKNKVLAFFGFGLSFFSVGFGVLPIQGMNVIMAWAFGFPAYIMSKYGMDSTKYKYAKVGKILSILGMIISIIITFIVILIDDLKKQ